MTAALACILLIVVVVPWSRDDPLIGVPDGVPGDAREVVIADSLALYWNIDVKTPVNWQEDKLFEAQLLGIEMPTAPYRDEWRNDCFGAASDRVIAAFLPEGEHVFITEDIYWPLYSGVLPVYMWVPSEPGSESYVLIQEWLVSNGFAWVVRNRDGMHFAQWSGPNWKYWIQNPHYSEWTAAESEARIGSVGLWGSCPDPTVPQS